MYFHPCGRFLFGFIFFKKGLVQPPTRYDLKSSRDILEKLVTHKTKLMKVFGVPCGKLAWVENHHD